MIGRLETLIARHPYREGLRAQLMLALYRGDRQADALQAYQDARRALVEELGIEPGERLRELERAILAQDQALAGPAGTRPSCRPELDAGDLMVGRNGELDRLRGTGGERAAGGWLVLVTGETGIGKTRLAAELAAEVRRERRRGALRRRRRHGWLALRAAVEAARAPGGPTLLVVDDVDHAGGELRAALREVVDGLATAPTLVLAMAEAASSRRTLGADASLSLGPLEVGRRARRGAALREVWR